MPMYAKLFTSIYQGTLRGDSHGLLVFTNLLAHADRDGSVDIHPRAISEEVGLSLEQVRDALLRLEAPDAESRSPEEEGRRIIRIDAHRAWGWHIVNHAKYNAIRNAEDRREQNRRSQEKWRERQASASDKHDKPRKPPSAHVDVDVDVKVEATTKTPKTKTVPASVPVSVLVDAGFDEATAAEFIRTKSERKAPLTERAWRDHLAESKKAGWTPQAAAEKLMAKTWKGFEARYVAEDPRQSADGETAAQRYKREQVAHMTGGLLGRKPALVVPDYIDAENTQRIGPC